MEFQNVNITLYIPWHNDFHSLSNLHHSTDVPFLSTFFPKKLQIFFLGPKSNNTKIRWILGLYWRISQFSRAITIGLNINHKWSATWVYCHQFIMKHYFRFTLDMLIIPAIPNHILFFLSFFWHKSFGEKSLPQSYKMFTGNATGWTHLWPTE